MPKSSKSNKENKLTPEDLVGILQKNIAILEAYLITMK